MDLKLALDEKMLDSRIRDRLVAEGKLSEEEVKKYLESLPDESENIEVSTLEN